MTKLIFFVLAVCLPLAASADYKVEEVKLKKQIFVTRALEGKPEHAGKLIAEAMGEVHTFMKEHDIKAAGKPIVRTLEWSPANWKFEAGLPVAKKPKVSGKIQATVLPAGRALKTIHTGPQDTTKEAFTALSKELTAKKLEKAGPHWVVYVSDPSVKREEQKTEVYFPVK